MSITTKSIGKAWQSVKVFNDVASNLSNVDVYSVDNQLSFIFSELEETITGFEADDAVEVVDGACDLFVTVCGLMQKLEAAGFDVETALARVNENNMSKYPSGTAYAMTNTVKSIVDPEHTYSYNKKHDVFVIKDKGGKIRKPTNFVPVDLSDCVPKKFFAGAA